MTSSDLDMGGDLGMTWGIFPLKFEVPQYLKTLENYLRLTSTFFILGVNVFLHLWSKVGYFSYVIEIIISPYHSVIRPTFIYELTQLTLKSNGNKFAD